MHVNLHGTVTVLRRNKFQMFRRVLPKGEREKTWGTGGLRVRGSTGALGKHCKEIVSSIGAICRLHQ